MATNPDDIVSRINELCKQLICFAQESEAGTSAYEAESVIFHRMLQMARLAIEAFLEAQAKHYHHSTTEDAEGRTLPYSGERGGVYYSIFGTVQFARSYYCGGGHGSFPMDAGVNLPLKGQSDFLRKMAEELAVSMSYEDVTLFLASYFPVSASTRGVQAIIETDCQDAEAYYEQAPPLRKTLRRPYFASKPTIREFRWSNPPVAVPSPIQCLASKRPNAHTTARRRKPRS